MSRHSPECSGLSQCFAGVDEIDYGFVQENQAVSAERGGRARITFPDPAGSAGQNWRANRSSTTRSISAADRRILAHREPIARTKKVNPLGIYNSSKAAGGPCASRHAYDPAHRLDLWRPRSKPRQGDIAARG